MLTREEILPSYNQNQFPDKLLDESFLTKNKNIFFYDKSSTLSSEKFINWENCQKVMSFQDIY